MNLEFLDDESNPIIFLFAEWIAIPTNNIDKWLDTTTLTQVTLLPDFTAAAGLRGPYSALVLRQARRSLSLLDEDAVL